MGGEAMNQRLEFYLMGLTTGLPLGLLIGAILVAYFTYPG
jgi:hypothetical protein